MKRHSVALTTRSADGGGGWYFNAIPGGTQS
jgi:hypothetical protein